MGGVFYSILLPFLHIHHRQQFFLQIRERPPKVSVVPLQDLDLIGINATVDVQMYRYLVKVVGVPLLEGHQLLDVRLVNMEHIVVEDHFPHIDPILEMPASAMRSPISANSSSDTIT